MRAGMRRGAAAEAMGFVRVQVIDYIRDHEGFEGEVLEAEAEATEHVEEALYQAAVSGNVGACKMWLDLKRSPSMGMGLEVGNGGEDPMAALLRDLTADGDDE